ncbi:hypothetical protein AK812_SmicGene39715 [Symbiodinium microadriaticum]|uniref:Uncharacterized protein n=1 Tax=Symbiodinium microadriaticum TaxID=2951 RepID=A0A1Q9CAH7_SYMMI|nr:hypothetical protein AK812_SmicGene39715 [Symbiodinium microadriaticum]
MLMSRATDRDDMIASPYHDDEDENAQRQLLIGRAYLNPLVDLGLSDALDGNSAGITGELHRAPMQYWRRRGPST